FSENPNSFIELVTAQKNPVVDLIFSKVKGVEKETETVNLEEFIAVKGISAQGNQLTTDKIKQINLHPPVEEPEEEEVEELENEPDESEGAIGEQASLFDFPDEKDDSATENNEE